MKDHTFVIELYNNGVLGTPDAPLRGSSCRCVFWDVYTGFRKSNEFKDSISANYAKAADILRKQHETS